MKSQDILLLMKMVSLSQTQKHQTNRPNLPDDWEDWEQSGNHEIALELEPQGTDWLKEQLTVRGLASSTGISKSQVSLSLRRNLDCGLATIDRKTLLPKANMTALYEFIVYGLRYVFPAKRGTLQRGITTAASAPVLQSRLLAAGDSQLVWPDAWGKATGLSLEPIHSAVTHAVRHDAMLYGYLALLDSIRDGGVRERQLAAKLLAQQWGIK